MNKRKWSRGQKPLIQILVTRILFQATKREKLVFTTLSVASVVLVTAFMSLPIWFLGLLVVLAVCIGLVLFSLWEDLAGMRYVLVPIPAVLITLATILNFLIIPMHPFFTFLFVACFAVMLYLTLLITNIFTISAVRVIPLIRAAHAANFFIVLLTFFLLAFFVVTLKLAAVYLFVIIGIAAFVPALYLYWSLQLTPRIEQSMVLAATVTAIISAEVAFALALWPVSPLLYALFVTTIVYLCVGVINQAYSNKLTRRVIIEYSVVLSFAFLLLMVTAQWGG